MRKPTFRLSLVATSLVAGLAACNSDGLTELNKDPNQPAEVASSALFTNATVTGMGYIRGSTFEHGLTGLWAQHNAEIQYAEADLHVARGSTLDLFWSRFYEKPLQDYTQILQQSANAPNLAGPALVMRAFMVQTMTDMWGDIPFTEANRGRENLTPKYDPQSVIYDSLFASLKKASTIMIPESNDVTSPRFARYAEADPVYGRNGESAVQQAAQWTKLANSLRARAAMRISGVSTAAAKARTELIDALAGDKVLTSNADNAFMTWPGGTVANPLCLNWAGCQGTRDDQRMSETIVDSLKSKSDPRLAKYADPAVASLEAPETPCDTVTYRGFPNGLEGADDVELCGQAVKFKHYSRPSIAIRSADSPSYIMTYSELLFIKAEAAENGWIPGSAAAFYNQAIAASMEQWGVTPAAAAAYLARADVAYKGGAAGRNQIAYEKWVSLYNLATEAFAERRRFDYPVLEAGPDAVSDNIPTRLPYPAIETSLNATNLKAATTAQGKVDISGRVWWDTK